MFVQYTFHKHFGIVLFYVIAFQGCKLYLQSTLFWFHKYMEVKLSRTELLVTIEQYNESGKRPKPMYLLIERKILNYFIFTVLFLIFIVQSLYDRCDCCQNMKSKTIRNKVSRFMVLWYIWINLSLWINLGYHQWIWIPPVIEIYNSVCFTEYYTFLKQKPVHFGSMGLYFVFKEANPLFLD